MNQLKRSKTLTELAADRLRQSIIDNEYMLGEPLSESLLAKSMGISKTPVREALALLKIEGLVTIVPQKGTFVFTLSLKEVNNLIELRHILESAALKLSYAHNRTSLLEALNTTIMDMKNALSINNIDEYLAYDSRFHECFFDFCNNKYLYDAYLHISAKASALRTRISHQPGHTQKTCNEHESIYNAVLNNEVEEAIQKLYLHFSSFEKFYIKHSDEIAVSQISSTRKNRHRKKTDQDLA